MKPLHTTLILLGLMLFSCSPEKLEVADYKPVVALPLAHSNFDVYDILDRPEIFEDIGVGDDGVVYISYFGELLSLDLSDVVNLEDISQNTLIEINPSQASDLNSGVSVSLPFLNQIPLNVESSSSELRIDEILLSGGVLNLEVEKLQNEGCGFTLNIPSIVDDMGNALVISAENSGFDDGIFSEVIDLEGYSINPDFMAPDENSLSVNGSVSVFDNSDHTATAGDFLNVSLSLSATSFEHIIGYFGQVSVNRDLDSVTVQIFENAYGGSFELLEAHIDMHITNSFGFPVQIDFPVLESINTQTGVVTEMNLEEVFLVTGQEELNGPPSEQVLTINNDNSNIETFLDPTPKILSFEVNATANPGEIDPSDDNFIKGNSRFDINVDVNLPLKGHAEDILIVDTLDANFDFGEVDEIDSLVFRLYTHNSFPVDADVQVEFLDENDIPIELLFDGGATDLSTFIISGVVDGPVVVTPSEVTIDRALGAESVEELNQTEKIVVRCLLNSYDSDLGYEVHFREENNLDVKIGVKTYGTIEL